MGRGSRRAEASILLKSVEGAWEKVGAGDARGIVPEGIVASANEAGPDTASFTLKRRSSVPWPDLTAFNQCEISIGGVKVWGGRVWEAPLSDRRDGSSIAVQARGWQHHLDDDLVRRLYVHADMTGYRDQRSFPAALLTSHLAGPQVQVGSGVITLIFPKGYTVVNNEQVCATFDAGAALIKRAVITWERVGISDADDTVRSRGSTAESAATAGDDSTAVLTGASGTISHTFGAARRYHHIMVYRNGAGGTFGADQGARITSIQLFGETAYESGSVSILKADQVIEDVLASGALPLLDSSTAGIIAGVFSIPDLDPGGYQTPRRIMDAANAYEGNLLGVDLAGRLFFRERPSAPEVEVGHWSGSDFEDASTNSAEGLYNRVIVRGQTADGTPVEEIRTATSSLLNRQGFTRTAELAVGSAMNTASAQDLGDIWLGEMSRPKFKGRLQVQGHGGARRISGGGIHASELLLRYGQLMRVNHLIDPTDGARGRDGGIKSISYVHDTETASVELDNERGNFATFLSRLDVLTQAALR